MANFSGVFHISFDIYVIISFIKWMWHCLPIFAQTGMIIIKFSNHIFVTS